MKALLAAALLVALLLSISALPAASAHTSVFSADQKVRASVGLLNEPVYTEAGTGLDLCFYEDRLSPRVPVNVTEPARFTATLRAPSGATHSSPLEVPFGKPNCLTFGTPLILTEPGQYFVDLSGPINGTAFAETGVKAGGEVLDRKDLLFPAGDKDDDGRRGLPGLAAGLMVVALAVLAAARRLR